VRLACLLAWALPTFVFTAAATETGSPAPVNFRHDILPILSDACYHCHGPDERGRKAKLRLDTKDGLFRTQKSITVVTPGDPAESELVIRTSSADDEEVMPPRTAGRQLKPTEIALLRRWVAEGAPWSAHWAFDPIAAATPLQKSPNIISPIDTFVRAQLPTAQLTSAPEADRAQLIRRVTLDLTGLPPTPAETDAFIADIQPGAYERVVDRLLASPRYGERMASDWLDIARYADTHGYQMDRTRAMWAYRDWVIKSFNQNLPFDQFATWQLAGDLLPNATRDQHLATAFNRLHNQNEEGGIVEEEYRVAYVADRVATFGTAFLGLTLDCARCHDHKFDPITQRDYYSLFAFFQNIDESGQISYKGFADTMPLPSLLLTTDEQFRQLEVLRKKTADAEEVLAKTNRGAQRAFRRWLTEKIPTAPTQLAGLVAAYPLTSLTDGHVANTVDPTKPGKTFETPKIIPSPRGPVLELDGENGLTFPGLATFKRTDAFTLSFWLQPPTTSASAARMVVLHHSKAPADAGSRGYEILLENGRVAFGLHYLWPGASLKIISKAVLPSDAWTHLTVTYDGSSRAAGAQIWLNGTRVPSEVIRDGLFKDITYGKSEPDLTLGYRFRDAGFKGGKISDLAIFARNLTALEVAQLAGRSDFTQAWTQSPEKLTVVQRAGLFDYFISLIDTPSQIATAALHAVREEQNALTTPIPEAMVMHELPQPKPAHILIRGAYDSPGDAVTADTPRALPPFPAQAPRNRLGLAQWLTAPTNPLLARVTVNRIWQMMFGSGIVGTPDNFGLQGTPPTHPELLDWLAQDFVQHRWDVKRTLRQIALSATYRQSSQTTPAQRALDPANSSLARGPARRLTAEMMRDQALAASGLLVEKIGGPSVLPYQPPGLWEEIAMGKPKYEQGKQDDLHRRSLYTFWKRTVPPPTMLMFDAAERNTCTVLRQNTSTPLQALALLNDVQFIEAARFIGQRMLREGGASLNDRLAWGFRLVTGRTAAKEELTILHELYESQRALFQADEKATKEFNQAGEAVTDVSLPAVDRAACAIVAQALLNFDETLMRR